MAEEAKERVGMMLVAAETFAAPAAAQSVATMNPAELLASTAVLGLRRLHEILSQKVVDDMDPKATRLIGDMALGANKLFMRAAEQEFKARRDDNLGKLLEMLREATEKK